VPAAAPRTVIPATGAAVTGAAVTGEDAVEADPAEVERRLAAEEALGAEVLDAGASGAEPEPSGEQDAPAPERPAQGANPDTEAGVRDADGPVTGSIPADEQENPADVNE